jgi:hypothetical protein
VVVRIPFDIFCESVAPRRVPVNLTLAIRRCPEQCKARDPING